VAKFAPRDSRGAKWSDPRHVRQHNLVLYSHRTTMRQRIANGIPNCSPFREAPIQGRQSRRRSSQSRLLRRGCAFWRAPATPRDEASRRGRKRIPDFTLDSRSERQHRVHPPANRRVWDAPRCAKPVRAVASDAVPRSIAALPLRTRLVSSRARPPTFRPTLPDASPRQSFLQLVHLRHHRQARHAAAVVFRRVATQVRPGESG
jgi:hypothetical protein